MGFRNGNNISYSLDMNEIIDVFKANIVLDLLKNYHIN